MFPLFSVGKKGKDTNKWKKEMMGKPVGRRKHFEEPGRSLYIRATGRDSLACGCEEGEGDAGLPLKAKHQQDDPE